MELLPAIHSRVLSTLSRTPKLWALTLMLITSLLVKNYSQNTKMLPLNCSTFMTLGLNIRILSLILSSSVHPLCSCPTNQKPSKSQNVSTFFISEHLNKNGKIYFLLTLYDEKSQFNRFMEVVKPYLKYMTTVDFGKVTYKQDFESFIDAKGLRCTVKERCSGNFWLKYFKFYMYEAIAV